MSLDGYIPLIFPELQYNFVRDNLCDMRKRFYKACLIPSGRFWYTYYEEYCATREEVIAKLCNEKDE